MSIAKFIDGQYRKPSGIVGRVIGNRMARQHVPENAWTVSLLAVQSTDAVLELGFGPGIAIEQVAALVPQGRVAGIDFSRTMVHVARRRNSRGIKAGRIDLRYGNVVHLPFADHSFDKVFSIHSLYFWPQPIPALQEALRILKPGGTLVLTILPKEKWPGWEDATLCHVYSGEEVAKMMTDVGFKSAWVEVGPENKPFRELAVIGVK